MRNKKYQLNQIIIQVKLEPRQQKDILAAKIGVSFIRATVLKMKNHATSCPTFMENVTLKDEEDMKF